MSGRHRYLGCIITDTLTDNNDIQKTIRGIYARSNMLIRKFSNCSYHVKKFLFQTYCTNFYCTQLWWTYSQEALRKVRVEFNNSFRHLMGFDRYCSASAMFTQYHVDDFNTLRRKYIYRFNCRIQNCDNSLVNNILKWREFVLVPSVKVLFMSVYWKKVTISLLKWCMYSICFQVLVIYFVCLYIFIVDS